MKLAVLSAAGGAAWEERLVTGLATAPGGVVIARRCVDIVDLLAVAASGQGRAALVAADLRRLDADAVDRLRTCGRRPGRGRATPATRRPNSAFGRWASSICFPTTRIPPSSPRFSRGRRDQATPPGTDRSYAGTTSVPITGDAMPPGAGTPPARPDTASAAR